MAANDIGDLKQSVDRLASDMRDRFEQVDQRFEQVDGRFERLEAQIRAESAETRDYVDLKAHETRRHFDVVAEHIEELLKPLADGISANRESIGRLERLKRTGARTLSDFMAITSRVDLPA